MKNNPKMSQGITLIALVVTIIVLLILAGISIMMLTGNNGILTRAGQAKDTTEYKQIEERIKLAYLASISDNGIFQQSKFKKELNKEFGENNYTLAFDNSQITIEGKEYNIADITGGKIQLNGYYIGTATVEYSNAESNLLYYYKFEKDKYYEIYPYYRGPFDYVVDENVLTMDEGVYPMERDTHSFQIVSKSEPELQLKTQIETYDSNTNSNTNTEFLMNLEPIDPPFLVEGNPIRYSYYFEVCFVSDNKPYDEIKEEYNPRFVIDETDINISLNIEKDHFSNDSMSFWADCLMLPNKIEINNKNYLLASKQLGFWGMVLPETPDYIGNVIITKDGKDIKMNYELYDADKVEAETLCVAEGTMITLADKTQKPIEEVTIDDKVIVWNMFEGKYEESDIAFIMNHDNKKENREIMHLYFSDGADIEILYSHGFYDLDLNKCVAINRTNYNEYIGHNFAKQSDNLYEEVKLERVEIEHKETRIYELVTSKHLTCYTNGLLSVSALLEEYVNTFEVDKETLTYNKEKMQRDIEQYGLLNYEEVKDKLPKYAFDLYNSQYMNVRLGKGIISKEQLEFLINYYNTYLDKLVNDSIK